MTTIIFKEKKYGNMKSLKEIVNTRLRDVIKELDTDCVKDGQSYYLRYELFDLLQYLNANKIEYNIGKMFKLFDKLNYKVCKAYKCPKY